MAKPLYRYCPGFWSLSRVKPRPGALVEIVDRTASVARVRVVSSGEIRGCRIDTLHQVWPVAKS